jgi:hypothetical protein
LFSKIPESSIYTPALGSSASNGKYKQSVQRVTQRNTWNRNKDHEIRKIKKSGNS